MYSNSMTTRLNSLFSGKKTKSATIDDITINNNVIKRSKSVRNLGFYLDQFLDVQSHISKLCQLVPYSLRNTGHVRNLIDDETYKMLVHSWISSRMDYCNSLFYGLPKNSIARLQLLQNKTARVVTKSKKGKSHYSSFTVAAQASRTETNCFQNRLPLL